VRKQRSCSYTTWKAWSVGITGSGKWTARDSRDTYYSVVSAEGESLYIRQEAVRACFHCLEGAHSKESRHGPLNMFPMNKDEEGIVMYLYVVVDDIQRNRGDLSQFYGVEACH
jgi:hypothetical protein